MNGRVLETQRWMNGELIFPFLMGVIMFGVGIGTLRQGRSQGLLWIALSLSFLWFFGRLRLIVLLDGAGNLVVMQRLLFRWTVTSSPVGLVKVVPLRPRFSLRGFLNVPSGARELGSGWSGLVLFESEGRRYALRVRRRRIFDELRSGWEGQTGNVAPPA